MGYNTAAIILNDALDAIATDSQIGDRILSGVTSIRRQDGGVTAHGAHGIHIDAIRLLPPQHADCVQIVAIGGNTIRELGYSLQWEPEALLRDLAAQLGYTLRKKPAA